jgi:hypothetical protein
MRPDRSYDPTSVFLKVFARVRGHRPVPHPEKTFRGPKFPITGKPMSG